ncbi:MAG: hypothetical protein AAF211_04010, partial [Myxococcota bacterium]
MLTPGAFGFTVHVWDSDDTVYSHFTELVVGTNVVSLSDIPGVTPDVAADIDGIRFNGYTTAADPGLVISEIRISDFGPPPELMDVVDLAPGDANCPVGGLQVDRGADDGAGGGTPSTGCCMPT